MGLRGNIRQQMLGLREITMRTAFYLPIAAMSLVGACATAPSESLATSDVLIANRLLANRMVASRLFANRLSTRPLVAGRMSPSSMAVNMSTAGRMLASEDGREVFSALVSCAFPADVLLTATVGGLSLEFPGELGLAPQWAWAPLDRAGQGWVSACMFARVNARDVAIPISMRGPNLLLAVDADERMDWALEEGAFFGNFFGPIDQPLQWFACRGRDQVAGEGGNLANRLCTVPDPANPGFTMCGMTFAGDCGSFASDRVCETFSQRGTFYQRCHSAPLQSQCHDHGQHEAEQSTGTLVAVFDQVITTFVTP